MIKIGTRGSKLALWQARRVLFLLKEKYTDLDFEIVKVRTKGDIDRHQSLRNLGNSVFIKELEKALVSGEIDLAVHSAKDMPSKLDDDFEIGAVLPRDGYHDLCLTKRREGFSVLKSGMNIGTGSPRRIAQLNRYVPGLDFSGIRGNVDTRLKKLESLEYDAIILSEVSLKRLGIPYSEDEIIPSDVVLPAAGQGFIAMEICSKDREIREMLSVIDDPDARLCLETERALLAYFAAGCHVPVGVLALKQDGMLSLSARILSKDGSRISEATERGTAEESRNLLSNLISNLEKKEVWEILNAYDR